MWPEVRESALFAGTVDEMFHFCRLWSDHGMCPQRPVGAWPLEPRLEQAPCRSAVRGRAQPGVARAGAERVERLTLALALDAVGDVLRERRPVLEAVPGAAADDPPRVA